jgi:hypothetical protein
MNREELEHIIRASADVHPIAQHVGIDAARARDLGQRHARLPACSHQVASGLRVVDAAAVALVADNQPLGNRLDFLCHYVPTFLRGHVGSQASARGTRALSIDRLRLFCFLG